MIPWNRLSTNMDFTITTPNWKMFRILGTMFSNTPYSIKYACTSRWSLLISVFFLPTLISAAFLWLLAYFVFDILWWSKLYTFDFEILWRPSTVAHKSWRISSIPTPQSLTVPFHLRAWEAKAWSLQKSTSCISSSGYFSSNGLGPLLD